MSIDELKQGLNVNSYLSMGMMAIIVSAALWINNSIHDVQIRQIQQEEKQNSHNSALQSKIEGLSLRIDGMVTHPELEAKLSELRLEQSKLELQLLKAQLGGNNKLAHP